MRAEFAPAPVGSEEALWLIQPIERLLCALELFESSRGVKFAEWSCV